MYTLGIPKIVKLQPKRARGTQDNELERPSREVFRGLGIRKQELHASLSITIMFKLLIYPTDCLI
jgi:hypothetical protein